MKNIKFQASTNGGTYYDSHFYGLPRHHRPATDGCPDGEQQEDTLNIHQDDIYDDLICRKSRTLDIISVDVSASGEYETRPKNMGVYYILKVLE